MELKIPPPIVAGGFAVLMIVASWYAPLADIALPFRGIISLILGVVGIGCVGAGVSAFREADTTISPTRPDKTQTIVASGIYKFTRNPMYLGLAFILAGLAISLSVLLPWILLAAFIGYITRFQIIPEERILQEKFGKEFDDYRGKVRRWI